MEELLESSVQPSTTRSRAHDDEDVGGYMLDVTAAAALLGRSENTVRRLIRQGELRATQVQGARSLEYRLREADVLDALGRLGAKASSHSDAYGRLDALAPDRSGVYEHDGRMSPFSDGEPQVSTSPTTTAAAGVAGVQALIEQATAPLVEVNRRLQDANERLTDQLMRQAEELGRLRERLDNSGTISAAQPDAQPDERLSSAAPVSDPPRSDDRDAWWDTLATQVRSTPVPTLAPLPRRSLIRRLLRR